MPARTTGFEDSLTREAGAVQEKISDAASQVRDRLSNLSATAAEKIDQNRATAASSLEKAAATLHEGANRLPGGEKTADAAHNAAERLNSAAEYVRENNLKRMMTDVETLVKNNPGPALITAAIVGFLIGRAARDRDS